MFRKVLIANRGEIAVRIQQTFHVLGIKTVAVYSDSDADSPHVIASDEAYPLHGNAVEETYLDITKLLGIAQKSGAEAIHPGYGFLSESPLFAQACRDAGFVFIGPSPESMESLGDKIQSKALALQVNVPVLPSLSVHGDLHADIRAFTETIGFPVMVKAAAGGGGRGMRLVLNDQELPRAMEDAQREASAFFGDGRIFLEAYIPNPRHVEFQVLADTHGNIVHLMERDCSIQRRHQKIIEETPSPILSPKLRARMGDAAVALARAASYTNAGTIEFLVDQDNNFYFLEANTRLQVEHPITEATLGLDLVEWQMRVAAGEPLKIQQSEIAPRGHAIQCRIYAENAYEGFLPATGTLTHWAPPSGPGIRVDSGVTCYNEITTHYDPLLAKLIVWGPDRPGNLKRAIEALKSFVAVGVVNNIAFLTTILSSREFQDGLYDTGFLENHVEFFSPENDRKATLAWSLAAWAFENVHRPQGVGVILDGGHKSRGPWQTAGFWRL